MRAKFPGLLLLCASVCAVPARATNAPAPATAPLACAASACRSETARVRLLLPDASREVEIEFPPAPYVSGGAIVMFPGETLVFRFSGNADAPGTPVFEKQMALPLPQKAPPSDQTFQSDAQTSVSHDPKTGENVYFMKEGSAFFEGGTAEEHLKGEPPGTMIVSYHQAAGHPDMVLRVEHNFPNPLKYDAEMERVTPNGPVSEKTSTCPVQPVLAGNETWPYPIGTIRLKNFRFVDTSKGFNCD